MTRIVIPFKEQDSANLVKTPLKDLSLKLQPFLCMFAIADFLDLLKTLKSQHQKSQFLYAYDFFQSNAFLWFPTLGFTYLGRNAL